MARSCKRKCRRKPCCPVSCTCCESWPRSCSKKSCWNLRKCACLNRSDCSWTGRCEPAYRANCGWPCYSPPAPAASPAPASAPAASSAASSAAPASAASSAAPAASSSAGAVPAAKPASAALGGGKKVAKAAHKYVLAEQDHQAARLYAAGVRDSAMAGGATAKEMKHQSRKAAKWLHRAERHRAKSYSKLLKAGGCGCA